MNVLGAELVFRSHLVDRPDVDRVMGLDGVDADVAMVRPGSAHVELWTYRHPEPVHRRSPANALGYPHFALSVCDIETEHQRLTAAGMAFVGSPVHLGRSRAVYG